VLALSRRCAREVVESNWEPFKGGTFQKEFAMYRIVVLCSIVALALAGVIATSVWPNAAAQDASTVATATHPVVGTWWWENISADPFDDSYAIFHADGTYVEETSYIGAGIGSWQATGERTADLVIVFQDIEGGLDPNQPAAFVPGTITFRLSIEVDSAGNVIVARGPAETRSPDGTLLDEMTFEGTATHLGVGWVMPVATPTT
jgi:hypothetical protein